jgi:hypothetical protein
MATIGEAKASCGSNPASGIPVLEKALEGQQDRPAAARLSAVGNGVHGCCDASPG